MRKMLTYIIIFLFPFTLTVMFIREANDVDDYGSVSIIYNYLSQFPSDHVYNISHIISNTKTLLLDDVDFTPDWSGNIFDDIAEVGSLIADGFEFVINFFKWTFKLLWNLFSLIIDTLTWIVNFPAYIINA